MNRGLWFLLVLGSGLTTGGVIFLWVTLRAAGR